MSLLRLGIRFPLFWLVPLFAALIYALVENKPTTKRWSKPQGAQINVETKVLSVESINVEVKSYGLVKPRTQSQLVAQVGGRVDWVSEQFREGGYFQKGERLLTIEQADYKVEVDIAYANLADAESKLQEQEALAAQARQDWNRLKRQGEASPLVLREPQVAAAQANVKSAQARYKKAQLNLERTNILAPFDGRVLQKNIDYGQVVSNNATLGTIYSIDAIEVLLPIKNNELALLNAPEAYRHKSADESKLPNVTLFSELSGNEKWQGKIVRTAAAVSDQNRQLSLVAQVNDPYGQYAEGKMPLKIGQYVTARIQGKTLENAIQIPNSAIYQGSYVYLYKDGVVNRQAIEIAWQNEDMAIVQNGLTAGDELVLTPLGRVNSGTPVARAGDPPPENKWDNKKRGEWKNKSTALQNNKGQNKQQNKKSEKQRSYADNGKAS